MSFGIAQAGAQVVCTASVHRTSGKTNSPIDGAQPLWHFGELGGKSTLASIANRAAFSTIPIGFDDIRSDVLMEDIAVLFYNSSSHSTVSSAYQSSELHWLSLRTGRSAALRGMLNDLCTFPSSLLMVK